MKKIGIICKSGRPEPIEMLKSLIPWLKDWDVETFIEEEAAREVGVKGYKRPEIPSLVDVVIVLGGDGTLLSVARLVCKHGIPLVGINLGGLGFITEVYKDEMFDTVEKILTGECSFEDRMMLKSQIYRKGEMIAEHTVLNDTVINKGALARIIDLETHINGSHITTFKADGLIVSTPTGSTAYSLSAGGPILYPTLDSMTITPICSHTLTNRPIVVPGDVHIDITVKSESGDIYLTLDGQVGVSLNKEDTVRIEKSPYKTRLLTPCKRDYYQVLRAKLKWGER